ncbi:MAG: hypothetical protein IPI44_16615 [Sulfuritalea sp.]|nr:hypothetical protein [Sulfuritalea sp.]
MRRVYNVEPLATRLKGNTRSSPVAPEPKAVMDPMISSAEMPGVQA